MIIFKIGVTILALGILSLIVSGICAVLSNIECIRYNASLYVDLYIASEIILSFGTVMTLIGGLMILSSMFFAVIFALWTSY